MVPYQTPSKREKCVIPQLRPLDAPNPHTEKLYDPRQKNIFASLPSVLFTAQPTQFKNHVKRQAQRHGFDVSSHPTPGTSAEGVDQDRCGWVLTNTADRLQLILLIG
jgi:hypothetical protein